MTSSVSAAVRGAAAFSCLGLERKEQVDALSAGRTGLRPVGESCLFAEPSLVAGSISACEDSEDRGAALADLLVERLLETTPWTERERRTCAVFAGAASGASSVEELEGLRKLRRGEPWRSDLLSGGPGRLTARVAHRWGSRGPQFTYTTACTSSAVALVMALRMLKAGMVERALVFGVDVLMMASLEGFRRLQLYSGSTCRPFDRTRDGLQIGEGCVGLALEPSDGSDSRSRFRLLGGCVAHDPSHIAAGSNDGRTAARIVAGALRSSGVSPCDVTAVKAHGTGTVTNDLSELQGLRAVFGDAVPPFASLKGLLGHTLGCCSALETVLWTWCLREGFAPASHGFEHPEEGLPAPLTANLPTGGRPGVHLFTAFGFGGTSVAYVVADGGTP